MPPTTLTKTKKKATPKWKLYIPKEGSPVKSILVRMGNGKIGLPETRADAEKALERAKERASKNKASYYAVTTSEQELRNVEEHMREVPLTHTFYGPIKLGKPSFSRHGITQLNLTTHEGFHCLIHISDLLMALKSTLVTEGLVFGTWGVRNTSGEPLLYLVGGVNHPDKQ
jgi:hypothetical protein